MRPSLHCSLHKLCGRCWNQWSLNYPSQPSHNQSCSVARPFSVTPPSLPRRTRLGFARITQSRPSCDVLFITLEHYHPTSTANRRLEHSKSELIPSLPSVHRGSWLLTSQPFGRDHGAQGNRRRVYRATATTPRVPLPSHGRRARAPLPPSQGQL